MSSPTNCGQHPPMGLKWPVLYANRDLIGQGTLLVVSDKGCQVTGTMPVEVDMSLKLWISPEPRDEALFVKQARVVWAHGHRFGLELREMDDQDREWLTRYLTGRASIVGS
jgi:hypothetical protein